jgi:isoleucyl-tRNA synthetase
MPFAQYHYPFENKELFEQNYPADFICEGIDQTRGWFYTMHTIGTMLFGTISYKNLIVNELILDKKGLKMSKTKGNTVNPFDLFDKYGADSTRWYLVTTSPPWRPTLFDEEGIVEVQRKFFGTLLNTYSFFALYANVDGFTYKEETIPYNERPEIDRWIISKLNSLVKEYEEYMEAYDPTKAARAVSDFTIDQLSNWYVRRSRRRFWKSEVNKNKLSAYQSLYECLVTITKLTSPFAPFFAEELYRNLNTVTGRESAESVHLVEFPLSGLSDPELEEKMDIAQRVVSITRAMRAKSNLKVRQPLNKIVVSVPLNKKAAVNEMKDVILEEVNIKTLEVLEDDSGIVNKSAKPNFKSLGPKFGKLANKVAGKIKELTNQEIEEFKKESKLSIVVDDNAINLFSDDMEIISKEIEGWLVETDEGITVGVDTELTEDLIAEGYAREFVNRIQNMRKDAGFDVVDRIKITYNTDAKFSEYISKFTDYISAETLGDKLIPEVVNSGFSQEWKIGDFDCKIVIEKVIK